MINSFVPTLSQPDICAMPLHARDIMRSEVRTVDPNLSLPELERRFMSERFGGFPVVEQGRLVGIVSRSDIVRQLCVEQTLAEAIADYYREVESFQDRSEATLEDIARRVGHRIEHLKVRDVMIRNVHTASPDDTIQQVARLMLKHRIHRVPITEEGRLVGIITTFDLTKLFSEGEVGMD